MDKKSYVLQDYYDKKFLYDWGTKIYEFTADINKAYLFNRQEAFIRRKYINKFYGRKRVGVVNKENIFSDNF